MSTTSSSTQKKRRALFFDWGGTLMRDFPDFQGPMYLWPEVEVLPAALETLELLFPSWTIAVATNALDSNESQIWAALQRSGLAPWIDLIYSYRSVGYRKPAAEFFEYMLNDLHLASEQCVMVGDDLQVDVLGANRAGIFGIWLNTQSADRRSGQLYTTIHHWRELPTTLETLVTRQQSRSAGAGPEA